MAKDGKAPKNGKRPVWKTVLMWVFFPVGLFDLWLRHAARNYRTDITTKTAIINTVVFAILMLAYMVVAVVIAVRCGAGADVLAGFIVVSILLLLGLSAVFAALCTFTARTMLEPLKSIADKMDEITAEDMSVRLETHNPHDELGKLSLRINDMLDGIQSAFERQSNFISDASHELRTPISVIRGYADLLKRWGKNDKALLDEAIDAISTEADNMRSIVEQLLYLAKLGSLRIHAEPFDVAEAVADIVGAYRLTVGNKRVTCASEERLTVLADKSLTVELIRIITDNAIKYTADDGCVDIRSSRAADGGVEVVVSDDGVGISEEDLPHIFDRFYRCDKARGRKEGSTGLGLAIAKSIAETMGGNIRARSVLGEGSTFTIVLPAAPPDESGALALSAGAKQTGGKAEKSENKHGA